MTPGNIVPELPDLSAYPAWVNGLAGTLVAVGIALIALVTWFGRWRGQQTAPLEGGRTDTAQLAMVTLDSTAIREHTRAVTQVADQLTRLNSLGDHYLAMLEQRQGQDELRAAREAGIEEGERRVRAARSRRPPPKKPSGMNLLPNQRP